jgi:tRNA-specific adenosine deaminase 1
MKCLPQNKISQTKGIVLHDWHAEILAIRSFNFFLLQECHALAISKEATSDYIRLRNPEEISESMFQPFALKDDVDFHMYCSEAPCGDASMELTQAAQENGEPWVVPVQECIDPSSSLTPELRGRSYFSELGIIRRKPSRPDAPPTLSKSCSDKIALKQCTSLLSSPVSILISPSNAYLKSLILPKSQHSETACGRAFSPEGRMKELDGKHWEGGYRYQPIEIQTTGKEFAYSRRQALTPGEKSVPSNIAASWIHGKGGLETIIGGVKQGRKQHDMKGASRVCKHSIWGQTLEIAALVAVPAIQRCLSGETYRELKTSLCLQEREGVKDEVREKGLRGWIKNAGGEEFCLVNESSETKVKSKPGAIIA